MATASEAAAGVEEASREGPQAGGTEIAFFDLETSVPQRAGQGYALLEFGAILVCPRRLVEVACYATLVRPADLGVVSAASVRCNGITRDAVAAAPCFRDVADKVYDLLHGERPAPSSFYFLFVLTPGTTVARLPTKRKGHYLNFFTQSLNEW